jgi:hypothetical protein
LMREIPPRRPFPPGQCGLPNSQMFHRGAYFVAVRQRMIAAVQLEDLPSKTSHRLLKSVTWTEVEGASHAHIPLRQLLGKVARRGQRLVNLRAAIAWLSRRP